MRRPPIPIKVHYLESDLILSAETEGLTWRGNHPEITQDKKPEIKATAGAPRDLAWVSMAWPDQA